MNRISFANVQHAHLTEEQFTDCVLGIASAQTQAHLAECQTCDQEIEALQSSVQAFARAGRLWSELQPAPSGNSMRRRAFFYGMRPVIGFAAAAVAVVCIAIPVGRNQREHAVAATQVQSAEMVVASISPAEEVAPVPVVEEVAPAPIRPARLVRASAPVATAIFSDNVLPSDTMQEDNDLMGAINNEIARPVSGNLQSVLSTVTSE